MRAASTDLLDIPQNFRDQMERSKLNDLLAEIDQRHQIDPEDLDLGDESEDEDIDETSSGDDLDYD